MLPLRLQSLLPLAMVFAATVPGALPDPLLFSDGTPVLTAEVWKSGRAPQLRELFQQVEYGHLPPAPARTEARVEREEAGVFDGRGDLREVSLTWGMPGETIHLLVVTPRGVSSAPVFLGLSFVDPHEALPGGKQEQVWNLRHTLERGYAVALFWNGDVVPDKADEARERLKLFRPPERAENPLPEDCATIGAWAWGIMRAVDYLTTAPGLDGKRIALVGHSRNGKTALLAAAMDERIALIIPSQAGCGGTAPSRVPAELSTPGAHGRSIVETVARINTSFPHWFCENFKKYNDDPGTLPLDQHELIALCAPRPVLISAAAGDLWANPDGQFAMLQAADPVYRLVAGDGLASAAKPEPLAPAKGRLAYFIRPGKHEMNETDWNAWLDYADVWLKAR